jgi:hypothetical protein
MNGAENIFAAIQKSGLVAALCVRPFSVRLPPQREELMSQALFPDS